LRIKNEKWGIENIKEDIKKTAKTSACGAAETGAKK